LWEKVSGFLPSCLTSFFGVHTRSAKLKYSLDVIITWSMSGICRRTLADRIWFVHLKSSSLGKQSPEGWLCPNKTDETLFLMPNRNTSRGCTRQESTVPRNSICR